MTDLKIATPYASPTRILTCFRLPYFIWRERG